MDEGTDSGEESDVSWQVVTSSMSNKRRQTKSPQIFPHKKQNINNNGKENINFEPSTSKQAQMHHNKSATNSINNNKTATNNINNNPNALMHSTAINNKTPGSLGVNNAKNKKLGDNRFSALSDDDESDTDGEVESETKEAKPPPIFIPMVADIKSMINSFSKIVSLDDFSYKAMRDSQIRIMAKYTQTYRTLVEYLNKKNIAFHTYQMKQNRAYRVVVKKLHYSTPIPEIKTAIEKLGHKVRNIMNIRNRFNKEPLSMFYVDLEPSPENKTIYDMWHINNAIVQVEPPRKMHDLVQCHRCQEFGHSKSYCKKPARCVKCGMDHLTINCTKQKETPPKCANCTKTHPANYKGCIVYKKILNRQHQNRLVYNRQPNTADFYKPGNWPTTENHNSTNYSQQNNLSYSEAVRYSENTTTTSSMNKIEVLLNKQIELTNTLLNMMSILIAKLCN